MKNHFVMQEGLVIAENVCSALFYITAKVE